MRAASRILSVLAVFTLAAASFASCAEKAQDGKPKKDDIYAQVELFADALAAVRSDYVEEVDPKKAIYGAMSGMLSSLDDYSQFMEPDEYKEIQVETKGQFGGIGIEISMRDGIITIVTPLAGTPAEAAGLKPGDKIVKIDGKITRDMSLDDAVKKMRGRPGTSITMSIWRDKAVLDVTIKRDTIEIRSIKKAELVDGKTGYIKLVEFQENTARDLDEALKSLESQGMDALILDIRNNPGGLLDGAIEVAERFLPKDKAIVSIRTRDAKKDEVFKSSGRFTRPERPLVIIVNEGSASASEIVAGAIKDNRRGIVLGMKTFGKGSVQTVIPLKDGSALRLTTALYLTPSGAVIKGEGIKPDVVVERSLAEKKTTEAEEIFDRLDRPADAPKPDDKAITADVAKKAEGAADNQLDAAVNFIRAIKGYQPEKR